MHKFRLAWIYAMFLLLIATVAFAENDTEPYGYQYNAFDDSDSDGYTSSIDCNDTDPFIHPGQTEICNGKDDDCDGYVDEDLVRQYGSEMGECVKGVQRCVQGEWIIIEPEIGPTVEECDNIDNDCDGSIDEGLTQDSANQHGLCENNYMICAEGVWGESPSNYILRDEICDNLDNDCDGLVDDELNELTSNQKGLCFGNTETCLQGFWEEDFGNYIPTNESCDRADNDCDGFVDEDFDQDNDDFYSEAYCSIAYYSERDCNDFENSINPGRAEICSNGIDEDCDGYDTDCKYDGDGDGYTFIIDCDDDDPYIYPGVDEICDNKDNDCDGTIDEDLFRFTYAQEGLCLGNQEKCDFGEWNELTTNYVITEEDCDGFDNNCDGRVDEDLFRNASNRLGLCSNNINICSSGLWINHSGNYLPVSEIVDEKDNDCDGSVDESTNLGFSFVTNKDIYSLNDPGTITLFAPDNSRVNITIVKPDGNKYYATYEGDFPYIHDFSIFSKTGKYQILVDYSYLDFYSLQQQYVDVLNSMTGEIDMPYLAARNDDIKFDASASGGDAPYTYSWDFGDGWTEVGEIITHSYIDAKEYTIKLIIKDSSSNEVTLNKKIRIQDAYKVNLRFIDNNTERPIEDLRISVGEESDNTDKFGEAEFTLFSGNHYVQIDDDDYLLKNGRISVNGDNTYNFKVQRDDKISPLVDILYPTQNMVVNSTTIPLVFRVIDENDVECTVYTKKEGSWWEYIKKLEDIDTTRENEVTIDNVVEGINRYRISCTDKFLNAYNRDGTFVFLTENAVETPATQPKEEEKENELELDKISYYLIQNLNRSHEKIRETSVEYSEFLDKIEAYDDVKKSALDSIGLKEVLVSTIKDLDMTAKNLFNAIDGTKSNAEKILENYNIIKKQVTGSIPVSISFIKDVSQMPVVEMDNKVYKNEIKYLTEQYIKTRNADIGTWKTKTIANDNIDLDKELEITKEYMYVKTETPNGSIKEFTIFMYDIANGEKIEDEGIIFYINKTVLDDAHKVISKSDINIVQSDPIFIIKPDIDGKIIFTLNGIISEEGLKNVRSYAIYDNVERSGTAAPSSTVKGGSNKITGFFSGISITQGNTKIFIETTLIVVLLIVYIGMQLDLFSRFFSMFRKEPHMKNMKKLIKKAKGHIDNKDHENAHVVYKDIMMHYLKLNAKNKEKVYPKTNHIFNDMIVVHISNLTTKVKLLYKDDIQTAKALYQKAQELYSQLSSNHKQKISKESLDAFRLLTGKKIE